MKNSKNAQKPKTILFVIGGIVLSVLLLTRVFKYDLECRYKVGFELEKKVYVDSLYIENTWHWTVESVGKLLLENQLEYVETDQKKGPGFPITHKLAGYGRYLKFSILPDNDAYCSAFDYESQRSAYFLPALRAAGLPEGHCVAVFATTQPPQSPYKVYHNVRDDGSMEYVTVSFFEGDEKIGSKLTMDTKYCSDKAGCWVCENNGKSHPLAGFIGPFHTRERAKLLAEDIKSGSARYVIGKVIASEIEHSPNRSVTTDQSRQFWQAKWIDEGAVFLAGKTLRLLKKDAIVRVWLEEAFSGAGTGWDFASLKRHEGNILILGVKRSSREKRVGVFVVSPEGEPIGANIVDLGDIGLADGEMFIVDHALHEGVLDLSFLIFLPGIADHEVRRILRYRVSLT